MQDDTSPDQQNDMEDIEINGERLGDVFTDDAIRHTESYVANNVMQSERCWEIFQWLDKEAVKKSLSTREFIVGVENNRPYILQHHPDGQQFFRVFKSAIKMLSEYHRHQSVLREQWEGREGKPDPEEIESLFEIAEGYNQLHRHFDEILYPQIVTLSTELQTHCPELVAGQTTREENHNE